MRRVLLLAIFVPYLVWGDNEYLGQIFCQDDYLEEDKEMNTCGQANDKHDKSCDRILLSEEATCSDLRLKLKKNVTASLKLYATQNDCTLPDVSDPRESGFELLKEVDLTITEDQARLGQLSLANFCGMVNLISVLSDPARPYIEHKVLPLFINCSNVDFALEILPSQPRNYTPVDPGVANPFRDQIRLKVTNLGEGECQSRKIMMCLACQMETEELEFMMQSQDPRVTKAWQTMIAGSTIREKLHHLASCLPMHEGSLSLNGDLIDLSNVSIPCSEPFIQGGYCGVIAYVDPFDKCFDRNISNNLVAIPVLVNYSSCFDNHSQESNQKCQVLPDLRKNGHNAVVVKDYFGAVVKGSQIMPSHPWDEYVMKLRGMKRMAEFHQSTTCNDRCSALYEMKLQEHQTKPKLADKIMRVLQRLMDQFGQSTNGNVQKLANVAKAVLRCSNEDPETCPFKQLLMGEFVKMVKEAKNMGDFFHMKDFLQIGHPDKDMPWKSHDKRRRGKQSWGKDGDDKGDWNLKDNWDKIVDSDKSFFKDDDFEDDNKEGRRNGQGQRNKEGGSRNKEDQYNEGKEGENGQNRPDRERPDRERTDRERPDRERPDRERPDRERPDREKPDRERPDREKPGKDNKPGRPWNKEDDEDDTYDYRNEKPGKPWNKDDDEEDDFYDFGNERPTRPPRYDEYDDMEDMPEMIEDPWWTHSSSPTPPFYEDPWDMDDNDDDYKDSFYRPNGRPSRPGHWQDEDCKHGRCKDDFNLPIKESFFGLDCQRLGRHWDDKTLGIAQCACQLVWARSSDSQNKFCQRLSQAEKDDLSSLAVAELKGKLDFIPQDRKIMKRMEKFMPRIMSKFAMLMTAPLNSEDLANLRSDVVEKLNNMTLGLENDLGALPALISGLDDLTTNDFAEIASLINEVMGHFMLKGQRCDLLNAKMGDFPTRNEFCNSQLGKIYLETAMSCPIRQEQSFEASEFFYGMMHNHTMGNETYFRRKRSIYNKGGRGKPERYEKFGQDQIYWRVENCMVKRGQFCQLTGEYHWKALVSCKSCSTCRGSQFDEHHKFSPLPHSDGIGFGGV